MYYTILRGLTVASAAPGTFTHSLSLDPSGLVARAILHSPAANTNWPVIGTIGTNTISVLATVGTACTFDLEVQQIHSLIS